MPSTIHTLSRQIFPQPKVNGLCQKVGLGAQRDSTVIGHLLARSNLGQTWVHTIIQHDPMSQEQFLVAEPGVTSECSWVWHQNKRKWST